MSGHELERAVGTIGPVDPDAARSARERMDRLAKPPGSLGRLEELGVRLAAIAGRCPPPVPTSPVLVVAAGDHGVHTRGVTQWPQELSGVVAGLVASGGATAAVWARQVGATVTVVDVGLAGPTPPGVVDARVRAGTRDLSSEPALLPDEVEAAISVGMGTVEARLTDGADLVLLGEVGMANTTPSAALIATLTGREAAAVVGPGAANHDDVVRRKIAVVEQALARRGADREDPLGVLASVGGLEHAAIVGMILAGAAARVPVVLDGVTTVAAALVASRLAPDVVGYLVAAHRSTEPGASAGLDDLGSEPLLDLGLRLGEGTGALLAVPLLQAAARALDEVALLDDL